MTQDNGVSLIFCSQEDCLFGWATRKWIGKILVFSFIVGVICIMGFNYAVSCCDVFLFF